MKQLCTASALVSAIALAAIAPAMPHDAPANASAKQKTCSQVKYADRTRGEPDNPAGVVFRPDGDIFHVWDNLRDNYLVHVRFNYAGIADKWKHVVTPSDGGQQAVRRNVDERYSRICFKVVVDNPRYFDSEPVRYTTRP